MDSCRVIWYRWYAFKFEGVQIKLTLITVYSLNIENLVIWKFYAKLIPKVLTDDQKQRWMSVCENLLRQSPEDKGNRDNYPIPLQCQLGASSAFPIPNVKYSLKEHYNETLSAVKEARTRPLKNVPKSNYHWTFAS